MHLVTLEGLPRSCVDVVSHIQSMSNVQTVPSPLPPTATSKHTDADEIALVLSNVLSHLKILQRTQCAFTAARRHGDPVPHTLCGAHWVETPPALSGRARRVLHDISIELGKAVCDALNLSVRTHTIILLRISAHECFENLLTTMEARNFNLSDLFEIEDFLEGFLKKNGVAGSVFKRAKVHAIDCPAYMCDNVVELEHIISKIADIIRTDA
jgi:hypothetical protein